MSITLDVQGKIFKTNYDTIIKIPYFKDMFSDCGVPTETIFVDKSSHVFKHVLALTTSPFYLFPEKYVSELEFYGINAKEIKLYDKNTDLLEQIQSTKIMVERLQNTIKEINKPTFGNNPPNRNPFFGGGRPGIYGDPYGPDIHRDNWQNAVYTDRDPFAKASSQKNNNNDPFLPKCKPW
jgi:hypothetical protein